MMLTSRYYVTRILKSKDIFDLMDAIRAFLEFKAARRAYAVKHYCDSVRNLNAAGVVEAAVIPVI